MAYFAAFRDTLAGLEGTPNLAETILSEGQAKVRPVIEDTMKAVRSAMSLG